MLPMFEGKENVQEYDNYRGIQLMHYSLQIWKNIVKKKLKNKITVSKNQLKSNQ